MPSRSNTVLAGGLAAATVRQALVLRSVLRSRAFLLQQPAPGATASGADSRARIFILLPVLRESALLAESVQHFTDVTRGHHATVVVVTTERERVEQSRYADTIISAAKLAADGLCIHLHYPDPRGVKADQLNFAVETLTDQLGDNHPSNTWALCYDADSRPPTDSIDRFLAVLAAHPEADVLHQSSRFEVRDRIQGPLATAVADAGALRANRFVLAYELPRLLNRSDTVGALKRRVSSYVYTHVTGHGLFIRWSLLKEVPFPAGSPLEDMHYSFILNSRNTVMLPVPSLDVADVPASPSIQVDQAARWFYGPGRFRQYLRDPWTSPGPRAWLLSASAACICVEWLSCAIVPAWIGVALRRESPLVRAAAGTFAGIYAAQLVITDAVMSPTATPRTRIGSLLAYPGACTIFGFGGVIGAVRLIAGNAGHGKTERSTA